MESKYKSMTNAELIVEAKRLGRTGYSGKKKDQIIEIIMNPNGVKSPRGRPKGSGVGRPKQQGLSRAQTVEYSQSGLNVLTLPMLKQLATQKGISGYSGKNKDAIVALLLTRGHQDSLVLQDTKDGSSNTVTVIATALSRSMPSQAPVDQTQGGQKSPRSQVAQKNLRVLGDFAPMPIASGQMSPRQSMNNTGMMAPSMQGRVSPNGRRY